jgi:hypothetical protein
VEERSGAVVTANIFVIVASDVPEKQQAVRIRVVFDNIKRFEGAGDEL